MVEMEALPPDLRDLPRFCHPRLQRESQNLRGGDWMPLPTLVWVRKSALRLHPCRALPSAPVALSVNPHRTRYPP